MTYEGKNRKILVCGLPGAGKTSLSNVLKRAIGAVHFNADHVRDELYDLGFSEADRIEHARRMGWMADRVVEAGGYVICDFVCPTMKAREAFQADGKAFIVFVDRIDEGRFEDTNKMFQRPDDEFDVRVDRDGTPEKWSNVVSMLVRPTFSLTDPTALLIGRYQPFHEGHRQLALHAIAQYGQVVIGVRHTHGVPGNPLSFSEVKSRIDAMMQSSTGRYIVVSLPNVVDVMYGRDVGYKITQVDLDQDLQKISGTAERKKMGIA